MEETQQRKIKRRRRRRDSELSRSAPLGSADADAALCLLLASVSKINAGGRGRSDPLPSSSLVKRCLRKVLSFLSKSDDPVPSFRKIPLSALFSVLPVLLKSNNPDIACLCAKVVGMASLCSFDMNQRIASDAEVLESLVSGLRSSNRRVKLSTCRAVSDLSTSLVWRQRLLEHSALETLMWPNVLWILSHYSQWTMDSLGVTLQLQRNMNFLFHFLMLLLYLLTPAISSNWKEFHLSSLKVSSSF